MSLDSQQSNGTLHPRVQTTISFQEEIAALQLRLTSLLEGQKRLLHESSKEQRTIHADPPPQAKDQRSAPSPVFMFKESDERRKDMNVVNAFGFCRLKNGIRGGTLTAWSIEMAISDKALRKRMRKYNGMPCCDHRGNRMEEFVYPENLIYNACEELFTDGTGLLRANDTHFFAVMNEKSVERYGTIEAWANELHIPLKDVKSALSTLRGVSGRNAQNKLLAGAFFPETFVKIALAAMVKRAGEEQRSRKEQTVQQSLDTHGDAAMATLLMNTLSKIEKDEPLGGNNGQPLE